MQHEIAFEMATSSIRYGAGSTREVGADFAEMGLKNVIVYTDPKLSKLPPVVNALESLEANKVPYKLFDRVRAEPTDESMLDAIQFASSNPCDGILAVGGGSTIDTAKAANLYSCWPADFLD